MGITHYTRIFSNREHTGDAQHIGRRFSCDGLDARQLTELARLAFDGVVNINPGSASAGRQFQLSGVK